MKAHAVGRSHARLAALAFVAVAAAVPVPSTSIVPSTSTVPSASSVPSASMLGRSERGRPITVTMIGSAHAPRRLLVVGCIHGDETSGIAVAERLAHLAPRREVGVWIVSDLNPDGAAAGSRGNADGVDLNRNFPFRWQPLTGLYDSGPAALSEPESRIASRLIRSVRPTVTIWFHQHEDVVDLSGGNLAVERRYAQLVGLGVRRLNRYPGSVVGWENHALPGGTAFVVELPAGALTKSRTDRFARAALELVGGR